MTEQLPYSPLFDGIATWLMEQGLREASAPEIVQGLGQRLVAGGMSLRRVAFGGLLLHPVFGALDIVWDGTSDQVRSEMVPRISLDDPVFRNAPFFEMTAQGIEFQRYRLDQGKLEPEYPIFDRLRRMGVTDYALFFRSFGRTEMRPSADLPPGMVGVSSSFATKRLSGFSDLELDYLKALATPIALAIKSATTYQLARTLLDTYLGAYSGRHVLNGLVERGDGRLIDCVIWYSDLRDSTSLAEAMGLDDYLATINEYFDCTAGAVLDHGGEVLKFIGDGVMAIFPFADGRPAPDMCRAALSTAREAIAKLKAVNAGRADRNVPPLAFGIGLHAGQVMYGNVGTERRLDFTVSGSAVNQVTRLEGLSKKLKTPVIASSTFASLSPDTLVALGTHDVAGVSGGLEAYAPSDLAPVHLAATEAE